MEELIEMMNDAKEKGFVNLDWVSLIETYSLLKKEKNQIIDFAYGCTQHISREDIEEYYNKTYNPKKEELLSLLAKQAQELDLGYEEFELGGEG